MDGKAEYAHSSPELSSPIETPDGEHIFVFRYENPNVKNNHPNSETSRDELVGGWFTHSLNSLRTYILMRQPRGVIRIVQIPKDKLEDLKAANHETAQGMDIEPLDNYIIPDELAEESRTMPLTVQESGNNKFLLSDISKIQNFIDTMYSDLIAKDQLSSASIPGSLSPDKNSSIAPPPIETRS
jgi:hypothetical protein